MLWDPSHREGFLSFQGRMEGEHVFSWTPERDPDGSAPAPALTPLPSPRRFGAESSGTVPPPPSSRGGQEQEEVRNADYASKSRADNHADPVGAAVTFGTSRRALTSRRRRRRSDPSEDGRDVRQRRLISSAPPARRVAEVLLTTRLRHANEAAAPRVH